MFSDLVRNLSAGFRLLFFIRLEAEKFRPSLRFVCVSLLLCLLIVAGFDYTQQVGVIYFNDSGAAKLGTIFFFVFLTSVVVCGMRKEIGKLPLLLTVIFSALPWYLVFLYLFRDYSGTLAETAALWVVPFALGLSVLLRAARIVFSAPGLREYLVISGTALFLALLAWDRLFLPEVFFSYNPEDFDLYTQVDQEAIYYQQPRLLAEKLNTLQSETPEQADVYFIGFAGNGNEPVFGREVSFVRDMMDRSFLTKGRSILVSSDLENLSAEPLANTHNLETAINVVGQIMDVESDVLFLFLTSHGSDDATLQVALYPFDLKSLGSLDLRGYLDNSGILWRVIIISACFSGSFIDSLITDRTLIITAAALDRTSFGCSVDRDLTYFGETFFNKERLEKDSFIAAFQGAKESIEDRELSEGLTPSNPQIYVGALIADKLATIWPVETTGE